MNYDELDAAIVARIDGTGATFFDLRLAVEGLADTLTKPDHTGSKNGWRLIDRRLQALRKAGRIAYKRGGYVHPAYAHDDWRGLAQNPAGSKS